MPRVVAALPALPESVTVGKKAVSATPICAFAAAIRRSAAAMSGRRSSSVDGRSAGMLGRAGTAATGATASSAGGFPIRTAIACSSCARSTPTAIAWASVLCSWVRACATSDAETIPALYWFWLIRNDSL